MKGGDLMRQVTFTRFQENCKFFIFFPITPGVRKHNCKSVCDTLSK